MIGTKELCALLLAGGMGATSVVAVQKAKPAIVKPRTVAAKPATSHKSTANVRKAPLPDMAPSRILDCPLVGSPFAAVPAPGFDLPAPTLPGAVVWGSPQPGPMWISPNNHTGPTFPPAIPEPDAWAMLVAGFGLVGLSLRKRKAVQ